MRNLLDAIELAFQSHRGQVDKARQPYIRHCMRVMENVRGDDYVKMAAVLHDLLEDTSVTVKNLQDAGYPMDVVSLIYRLTREKDTPYMEYINNIGLHSVTARIKVVDLEDDMDLSRFPEITEIDIRQLEKYKKAWDYLQKKV